MGGSSIRTGRFVLSKLTAEDGDKYYRLSNNPNVMKYVTGFALSRQESDKMLMGYVFENDLHTWFGKYLIECKYSGELVGIAKLDQFGSEVEIGYRVMEEFWGIGVATEIARSLIRFSLRTLRTSTVSAFVNVENHASIRVLEKVGMRKMERIEDIDEIKYKYTYSLQTVSMMKKVLYAVLGLIAIVLIAALIMPKGYAVEKEITINRPKAAVYDYLESLRNQNNWSVWAKRDPAMKMNFQGTDRTVGFTYFWEGNDEVGKGEQEITKINKGARIDTQLRFLEPFESTSDAYLITESAGDSTTLVKWGFTGIMPYPMNAMLPFLGMDKTVGKDFSDGLANLKVILEK
jgi:RimJ/RimL family protein N-acetyltransferase